MSGRPEAGGACAAYGPCGDAERGAWRLDGIDTPAFPLAMTFPSRALCALRLSGRLSRYDPEADDIFLLHTPIYANIER